jgi:hypothetical protein
MAKKLSDYERGKQAGANMERTAIRAKAARMRVLWEAQNGFDTLDALLYWLKEREKRTRAKEGGL